MADDEGTPGVRTVKAEDFKPQWEVRELPEPPPISL